MTAEDSYRQLLEHGDEIGLATVYRVLTQFEAAGLVLKHNFEGGHAVYELDRGEHHDHMVDIESGKVIEFQSPEIEELQRQVAAMHGYEIEEHALVLYVRKKRLAQRSASTSKRFAAALASLLTSTPPSMRASSSSRSLASSRRTALCVMPSLAALLTR